MNIIQACKRLVLNWVTWNRCTRIARLYFKQKNRLPSTWQKTPKTQDELKFYTTFGYAEPLKVTSLRDLRDLLISTLQPQTEESVGDILLIAEEQTVQEVIGPENPTGYYLQIDKSWCYLGPTWEAANVTARQGDWYVLNRDGLLNRVIVEWLEERGNNPKWEEKEPRPRKNTRNHRTLRNLIWDDPEALRNGGQDLLEEINREDPGLDNTVDVMKVEGLEGTWILDDEQDYLIPVSVHYTQEHMYYKQVGAPLEIKKDYELKTLMRIGKDEAGEIREIRISYPDQGGRGFYQRIHYNENGKVEINGILQ